MHERLGVHAFCLSSGRAALALLLSILREHSHRREVVIPAYTCFSVPSAVVRAGLTIRLCDVDPKTLDLDLNALLRCDLGKALCVIPSGLYGMPGDLPELEMTAHRFGAALIDDAAQSLGATVGDRACGTFGDAGFYSFGRGKGLTTMGGGVIVTRRDDLARSLDAEVRNLPAPPVRAAASAVGACLAYAGMQAPSRYWIVDRMPFLDLGVSRFEPDFAMTRLCPFQERLAAQLLPLLGPANDTRRRRAHALRAGIERIEGVETPRPAEGAQPVYLRFPILARDQAHRSALLARLKQAEISASASYPSPIADIPGIGRFLAPDQAPCPGARSVAARIATLPTHPGVAARDVDRMVAIVRDSAGVR